MARSCYAFSFVCDWRRVNLHPITSTARLRLLVVAVAWAVLVASGASGEPPTPYVPEARPDEPLFSVDSPLGSIDYVAARGLRLGRTGLTIGGFTTLEIDKEESEYGTLELDGINFLVLWEPADFLRGFAEIEVGGLLEYEMGSEILVSDPIAEIERLYGDLIWNDALNLRFGKYQTPVGIWNLVPAEPFTWTASEPYIVETAFDEHQTGAALFGTVNSASNTLEYWLYGQLLDPLDPSEDPAPADGSVGGRLRYGGPTGKWAVGASVLASELDGRWSTMGGVDAFWQVGPLELQGEFAITRGNIPGRDVWGVYVQGVYDLASLAPWLRSLYFVGRYEHFDPTVPDPFDVGPGQQPPDPDDVEILGRQDADVFIVGLTWMPKKFLIFKAGYQFSDRQTELVRRGMFASFSVLF